MAGVRYLLIFDSSAECAATRDRGLNPVRKYEVILLAIDNEHGLIRWPLGQGHSAQRIPQLGDVLRSIWLYIVGLAQAHNDCLPRDWCQWGAFRFTAG